MPLHALCSGLVLSLVSAGVLAAPVPFSGSYSQNFNSLANSGTNAPWTNDSTLAGWSLFTKDAAAISQINVGSGGGTGGSYYSFGLDAADRALGVLASSGAYFGSPGSGAIAGWIALALVNNTASVIDAVTLRFNGEQWRYGGSTVAQSMTLEWGLGDSFATVATWNAAGDTFTWTAPVGSGTAGAIDGNAAGLVSQVGGDLRGLAWGAGKTLWLRWVQKRTTSGSSNGLAIDDVVIKSTGADTAPPVIQSSAPANNATNVSTMGGITLQFDEAVQAGDGSFELRKGSTVVATYAANDASKVTFSGQSVSIKPGAELDANTAYTLASVGSPVKDMSSNVWAGGAVNFTTGAAIPTTRISAIQGNSDASPLLGQTVTIDAVVTAYMPGVSGFYVQEQESNYDADASTSEGVLVYYGGTNPGVSEATVGKRVKLTAVVDEFNKLTELKNVSNFQILGDGVMPKPVPLTLPITDMALWERYEGMLVQITSATSGGKLVVSDNYTLGRYGDLVLSADKVLAQFTDENVPSQSGFAEYVKTTQRAQIILDDASSKQNPDAVRGRNGQPLSASNTLRAGDGVSSVVGVLDQFYSAMTPPEDYQTSYRVQPTQALNFTGAERPMAADLQTALGKASVKVASANVLNFFSKVGDTSINTKDVFTTPLGNSIGIRGANTVLELDRQKAKVVANLIGLQADVYGLMEVQNNGFADDSALKLLIDAMNASADKPAGALYAFVKAPFNQGAGTTMAGAGTDAITVAIVYRSDKVTPVGAAAVPNVGTYDAFTPNVGGARVPVAQTFSVPTSTGTEQFTVVVNHFKSKGSLLATGGNGDIADGQGNNNPARVKTATQLKDWLATKPTGSDSANVILVGDFNAYAKEDPVTYLESNGYAKVSSGYSYSFDGLWGSLDHIFVTPNLVSKVGKVVKWAINAEEPTVLDYNTEFKTPDQIANYYAATAYRSSDHNPIVMGLNFEAPPVNKPPVIKGVPTTATPVTVGQSTTLAALSVEDADSEQLVLTLTATNGNVQGVTDADTQLAGLQLKGTPVQINTQLGKASFVASAQGDANVGLSVTDGTNDAVTANYAFKVTAVVDPGTSFEVIPGAGGNVTGSLQGAGCKLASPPQYVTPQSLGITTMPSAGAKLPHGLLVLNAKGCDAGGALTVTMNYSQPLPERAELWKWGRTADNQTKHWYRVPYKVTGQTVSFELKDGGLGDDDLKADGNIADPTALVAPQAVVPPAATVAVPVMNIWGLLLLGLSFLPFAPLARRFSRRN
ncbi:ExeM/NucH family extracellular endonuclease [Diaphorobacter sp. HDW4B]|uniref:ExeM/NucH family extracellular endonuclease n=1 Tax=Diaphorobacter sp. HDW4B TaxID=2714925 RepID=UPI00140A70C4|nr:ExeM/NucH family extracellular endonuclease [Diaphorobacter sp. HDW4B]QIL72492.1 ExeM/NucH family extracellular endonuclease [Diaphorobacter sp. HDW4B]